MKLSKGLITVYELNGDGKALCFVYEENDDISLYPFLINSINADGTMQGYDISLIKTVVNYSEVPVIGCGGAGNFTHMKDAFLKTNASALACGSLFNFGDNNPRRAKSFLKNYNLPFKVS